MASISGRKINIIISTVLLALFLYLAFRNVNLSELARVLENANYFYIVLGISVGVIIGILVRVIRWRILLEPIKKDIPFRSLYSSTAIGYMVNNFIPRSGEVVRPYLLGKSENLSKAAAFGTIIIERIIDTVMFLLMFGIALIYFQSRIGNAFPEMNFAVILLMTAIFLLLFWVLFMMFKTEMSLKIVSFFTRFLPEKFRTRIDHIFTSLVGGFKVLKEPRSMLKIALYSLLLWIVYVISTFIPFYSFGIMVGRDTNLLDSLWNANLLLVLINVSMFIPAPAATGPYHYVCKVTLVSIFAISETKALGYATATHMVSFIIYLIVGLYYFITSHYKFSELKEKSISNA
jgi:uncharacterized protein (TIRG00374 family)